MSLLIKNTQQYIIIDIKTLKFDLDINISLITVQYYKYTSVVQCIFTTVAFSMHSCL